MPTVITCPACQKQLRLPDDLLGRPVQCPACRQHFEPEVKANKPPAPPRSEPEPVPSSPPRKDLNLSLDDTPGSAPRSEPRPQPLSDPAEREKAEGIPPWRPRPEPVDTPPRRESTPREDARNGEQDRDWDRDRDRDQDRDRDWDRDRVLDRDRRWDRDRDRDSDRDRDRDRDWDRDRDRDRWRRDREEDPLPRRDTLPHRANTVLTLGVVALSLLLTCVLFPISLVLGLIAWVMGGSDLRKMKAGEMDPEGRGNTQAGYVCGIIATVIAGLTTLSCAGFVSLGFIMDSQQQVGGAPRPRGGAPVSTAKVPQQKGAPNGAPQNGRPNPDDE
jgi:hypothetical protein